MKKPAAILILICLVHTAAMADDNIARLLKLDKTVRTDSLVLWYKNNIRGTAPARALPQIKELEETARKTNNTIGIATAIFIKGMYCEDAMKNPERGIQYQQQAIAIAERENLEYEWACYTLQLGISYFFRDKIGASIECLMRADAKFREIGYRDVNAALYLYNIGYVYYQLHNYRECLRYLHEAATYPYANTWIENHMPNTTALAYMQLEMYDSAFVLFNKLLQKVSTENDTLWMGIVSGNIGEVYIRQKRNTEALPYIEKNYQYAKLSEKPGVPGNALNALVSMAYIYVTNGNAGKALALLNKANTLWPKTSITDYSRRSYFYEVMAKASALQHDYGNAYYYLQMSKDVSDSISRRDDALQYSYVQQQLETEKHLADIRLIKAHQKAASQRRLFIISGITLLLVIAGLWYRYKIKKDMEIRDKKTKLLQSEKRRAEEELINARDLLTQYIVSISEKNNLIENFKEQLSKVNAPTGESVLPEEHFEYLQRLTEAILLTNEEWEKFKLLFDKVYKGFFIRLKHKNPDLTEAEVRLLALIKLNLSNNYIAQMLGISPSSVHKARYRLRKKLALPEEIQLEEMIAEV